VNSRFTLIWHKTPGTTRKGANPIDLLNLVCSVRVTCDLVRALASTLRVRYTGARDSAPSRASLAVGASLSCGLRVSLSRDVSHVARPTEHPSSERGGCR
jgi:hypothetical protein